MSHISRVLAFVVATPLFCSSPAAAQTLNWPDPAGERPAGALNPRLEAHVDEGVLTTGAFVLAGGVLAGAFVGYLYELQVDSCTADPLLAAIPFAGVPLLTLSENFQCGTAASVGVWLSVMPAQIVGLGLTLVALLAPSAIEAVYEEGAELAILPGAPGTDVGLSFAWRYGGMTP